MNYKGFKFSDKLLELSKKAQQDIDAAFKRIEEIEEYNGMKVLNAFIENGISAAHLVGSTGYGYGDIGRDTLDKVFSSAFGSEDALVRHSFASGTHALTVALFGILRTGDTLLSVTGAPYDTLLSVIGLENTEENQGSLIDFGVKYEEVKLKNGEI
ncbi:MAG: methionine gamma-lyase family protein, partial [Oscillospiraceae bacterium]